ncbi:MAG TPA: Pycsar system effector family protein [Chloroflexota bacterium]
MRTVEPTPRESNPHIEYHLDATHANLERMHGHVAQADNKALIALTFQGGMIAGFAVLATVLKSQLQRQAVELRVMAIILIVLFLITFLIATWKLFEAISPRVTPMESMNDPSALFFFGSIAGMDTDEFMSRMHNLHPQEIHDGLLKTTQSVARIAAEKYRNLRTAYICLAIQLLFFMVAALLVIV